MDFSCHHIRLLSLPPPSADVAMCNHIFCVDIYCCFFSQWVSEGERFFKVNTFIFNSLAGAKKKNNDDDFIYLGHITARTPPDVSHLLSHFKTLFLAFWLMWRSYEWSRHFFNITRPHLSLASHVIASVDRRYIVIDKKGKQIEMGTSSSIWH